MRAGAPPRAGAPLGRKPGLGAGGSNYFTEPNRLGRGSGSAKPGGASVGSCAGGFGLGEFLGGVVATEMSLAREADGPKNNLGGKQDATGREPDGHFCELDA